MRQPSFGSRRSATVILLIANIVAFFLQWALPSLLHVNLRPLALSVDGLRHGYIWQLVTFQFMHANLWHLAANCWVIYMFGREMESVLGVKSFLTLYFAGGIIGGILQVIFGLILPGHFGGAVLGASAGAFALTAAFATLFPERPLTLLLFFIIPVNMRAKFLLLFSAIITLWGIAFPGSNVAHAAHLGGMLTGMAFIKYAGRWDFHLPRFGGRRKDSPRHLVKVHSQKSGFWGRGKSDAELDLPSDEFLSKEVDPILDKINTQGIQSLTERERKILETARAKMGKR